MNNRGAKTFTITSIPFYEQYNQCYKNILSINVEPQGPLRKLVKKTRLPRLSPFQTEGPCNPIPQCDLVIQSIGQGFCCTNNSGYNLMTPDEIPDLISFLTQNGYQIETQITNMLVQSEIKLSNKRLVFSATYYGTNQPNITYMR